MYQTFVVIGENRRKNTWHYLAELMGEGACQPDISPNPCSLGCELSYGTCPISLHALLFKVVLWPNFGHCTTAVNVWGGIGEKTTSTILHSSWERGCVNLIFSPNRGWDVSYVMAYIN